MMVMTWWQAYVAHLLYEIETLFSLHRRAACIMLLLPVVYTMLFGGLFYENAVTHVPVVVCNLDDGPSGRQLVQDIAASPDLYITEQVSTADDAHRLLARSGASGVIVIPDDFSRRIAQGDTAAVSLTVDNGNTVLGGTVTRAIQQIVSTWDGSIVTQRRIAAGWQPEEAGAALTLSSRILGNPAGGYEDFFLIILILHAMQIGTVFTLGPSLVLDIRNQQDRIHHTAAYLLAKCTVALGLDWIALSASLAGSMAFLGLTARGDWISLVALMTAYLVAIIAFALCMGCWVRWPEQAITYALFYIMPSVLFAGAIWPRYSMDMVSLFISYIIPSGYVVEDARALMVQGVAPYWSFHAGVLIVYACGCFVLACAGLARKKRRYVSCGTACREK